MKTPLADDYLNLAAAQPDAETDPFFYTRLVARMEGEQKIMSTLTLRPSLLIGLLALLLCFNSYLFTRENKASSPQSTGTALQTFASSYDLTISTPY